MGVRYLEGTHKDKISFKRKKSLNTKLIPRKKKIC